MFASENFNAAFSCFNSLSCSFISSIHSSMRLISAMVSSVLQHWSQSRSCTGAGSLSSSLPDRSSTCSLHFLGDFLLTGMITDVGSIGRLREGNSSFCSRLPAESTKCSLHTRVLLFTSKFFRPILCIHTLSCFLLFNGSR